MNCFSGAHISRVTLGTINNSSALCTNNGYSDYTTTLQPDSLQAGAIKSITVLTGNASGFNSGNLALWIDFNKNGTFESSEYFFMGSGLGNSFTRQLMISSSTPGGLTTMRVRRVLNGSLHPGAACSSFLYGETEDYPVYIKPAAIVISHTPFRDTLYSPSIELNANIRQINVGLNTTDSLGPRLWVRRYGTTAWKILKGQMISGDPNNGNWRFLIPFDSMGVRRNGCDSIQYYFVAQDLQAPPSFGYLPEPASHSSVIAQQSAPSELFGFRIKPRLKDTIYVSQSDCRYRSLSSVNGLFSEINARGLEGDLTVVIESDLAESGQVPLYGQHQNGYRIQIRPSSAVVRNLNATGNDVVMLRLDSVKNFIIDGSFNGQGRFLRFSNASATANYDTISNVKLYHSCDSILIQHSIFENAIFYQHYNANSIWLSWGQNKNLVFYDNLFSNRTSTSLPHRHLFSEGGNNTAIVRKNEFRNFLRSGVQVLSGKNWIIDSNHFYRSVTPTNYSYDCSGVYVTGEGHHIEDNFFGGQSPFIGGAAWKFINNPQGNIAMIDIQGTPGTNAVVVRRNRIDNFIMSHTDANMASSFSGIRCHNNKAIIEENIIGNPNDNTGYSIKAEANEVYGVNAITAQPIIIRDNSVSSLGINTNSTSGTTIMYGIYSNAGSSPFTVNISRNKVFHLYNPWNNYSPSFQVTGGTAGINTGGGTSNIIEANTIHDVVILYGQMSGIIFTNSAGNDIAKIQRNRIYDLALVDDPAVPGGSSPEGDVNGIIFQHVGSPLDILNNQISLTNRELTARVTVRGIYCAGPSTSTTKRILYNSVFIGGTASGDAGSAVVVAAVNRPARIANNIFYNKRSGGTTGHYQYCTTGGSPYYTGFSSTQTNNNLYVLRDTTKFVNWHLVGSAPFSNWKTFVHPEDSSYLKTTSVVPDTGFFINAAKGDLHIDTSGVLAGAVNNRGRGVSGIDSDYDSTGVRSVDPSLPTDIGSDEFVATTNFIFSGNGSWYDPVNWEYGIMPPNGNISGGDRVRITGNAVIPPDNTQSFVSAGILTIAANASLNIQRSTTISGPVTINGLLENYSQVTHISGILTINGVLNNYAAITSVALVVVNNGGSLTNLNGGTLSLTNIIYNSASNFLNNGVLAGNANITGNLFNGGTLAPGSSPGAYTVTGNYTASGTTVHNFEVAGISTSQYDRLDVSGAVALDGTLNVTLINGFMPPTNHDLPIITGSSITGSFSSVSIPTSSGYALVYTPTSVILRRLSVLPVNFVSLQAHRDPGGLNLVWKVTGEQDLARYVVEESSNGSTYRSAGTRAAVGQSEYALQVPVPTTKTFYRVCAVDVDGKVKYSPIATYSNGRASIALSAYPSITTGTLHVQYDTAPKGAAVRILTATGQTVLTQVLPEGSQQTSVDVSRLAKGTYLLQYQGAGQMQTTRFTKL